MENGDVPVEVYSAEDYDVNADYVVDFIVADRTRGKKKEYLVKWKVIKMMTTTCLCCASYIQFKNQCMALPRCIHIRELLLYHAKHLIMLTTVGYGCTSVIVLLALSISQHCLWSINTLHSC